MSKLNSNDNLQTFQYSGTENLEVMLHATHYNRFLLRQIIDNARGREAILDYGSGIGTFSEMVRDAGLKPQCFEPDANQAAIVESKGFATFQSVEAMASGTFEYIFSLNVFEHIENDESAIRDAFNLLKPGGRIFIYVPAFQSLFGEMDRKVGHFRRYRRKSLTELVASAGFEVEKSHYVDSIGFVATYLFNKFSRSDGSLDARSIWLYDRLAFPVSRAIDWIAKQWFGKNVLVVATKPMRCKNPFLLKND